MLLKSAATKCPPWNPSHRATLSPAGVKKRVEKKKELMKSVLKSIEARPWGWWERAAVERPRRAGRSFAYTNRPADTYISMAKTWQRSAGANCAKCAERCK